VTTVYLVRHGQTAWNREKVFRGREDVPLNDVGRAQAAACAERLADVKLDAFYSSPLGRAMETARAIARPHGAEPTAEPGLIDLDVGQWQAKPLAEVQREFPDLHELWAHQPHLVKFPGGESLAAVRDRAASAVERLCDRHVGQTILLLGHVAVNRVLICHWLGLELSRYGRVRQDNACVNVFERGEGGWTVRLLNDTGHLRGVEGGLLADDF
jgi:broad specificity phosphatase PhoE